MNIDLEKLKEIQEDLFKQQCDLDIQKAMVKHFIKKQEAAISVTRCSTELLCVNKGDDNGITKGYEYKSIDQNETHYKIVDNYSYEGWFAKEHFKELS
tara:strand:- start:367 stop:660 length:294 start_codon:yes stop_codon:yes gene_type:complete